jgi:hypothetical protein
MFDGEGPALDLGDRPGTTSAGGHGMSPLPRRKR